MIYLNQLHCAHRTLLKNGKFKRDVALRPVLRLGAIEAQLTILRKCGKCR